MRDNVINKMTVINLFLRCKNFIKRRNISELNVIKVACSNVYVQAPNNANVDSTNRRLRYVSKTVAKKAIVKGDILYNITARPKRKLTRKRSTFFSTKIFLSNLYDD